ncbi:MAG: hypothetical protein ACRD2W_02525 [Acidimicrobiales bacterium]
MRGAGRAVRSFAAPLAIVAVLWGAAAYACTNLATMTLSSGAGHPGDTITLIGTSFPVPRTAGSTPTQVVVRWKSLDGPIIGTVTPDRTGTISMTFTVPQAAPGNIVILGTQRRELTAGSDATPTAYVDEPGTPARATFRVLAAGELPPIRTPSADFSVVRGEQGSTAMSVLMVLFGAVSLSLFAGGVIAFLYQMRLRRMTPQPWRTWGYY